ncbi:MAG TPA: phosphotransferase [Caldilineaceae bacterium]|nr:phosphotransferase [Caldilineaceae bacterium]
MAHDNADVSAEQLLATTGYSVPMETIRAIFQTVETLLSAGRPTAVQLSDLEQISKAERRNLLLRATVANPPADLPRTLIVKKVIAESYDPDDATAWDSARFLKDWAGAAFLSQVAPEGGHSPHFYGGDRTLGFILLEDMGADHGSLVEPLLGVDIDRAEAALYHFAERLAHMHADTWGHAAEFYAVVAALNPQLASAMRERNDWHERVTNVTGQLEALGGLLSAGFADEMTYLASVAIDPGPFMAYRHGDPCPDNFFWQGNVLRLLDFEFGHMGHALSDLAYGRMIFPTCWCCNRVPPTVVDAMERRYRTIFAERYPPILDDAIFGPAMTDACAIWVIDSLSWLLETALKEDREWGIATIRPRITAQLAAFVETSRTFAHLPALRDVVANLLATLQTKWPDLEPLPLYPALRG